ncbi:MAG: ABC transporter permease [Bryobacteraceae bacterium]|nr:ABC transporter permease [Bryobacteraceae bacterium]
MIGLFARLILRPLRAEPVRTLLTVLSVALGIAVVLAIELASDAATGSFRSSLETVAGEADYEVTAVGGLDERLYAKLATLPLAVNVRPRMEDHALLVESKQTLPLIGLDLVAHALDARFETTSFEPGLILASATGRKVGEQVTLRVNDHDHLLTVRAIVASDTAFALVDIGVAQELLKRPGKIDRLLIDAPESFESRLKEALPAGATLAPFGARTEENRKMLAGFRSNLVILSYIALVVGAFLIYNTISVSVVRRRAEIGILRAIGMTSTTVLAMFLAEALLFGLAGIAIGVPLGRLMAEAAVGAIGATVQNLYVSSQPGVIALSFLATLKAVIAGLTVTLAAAWAPAREAAAVAPVEAMARGRKDYEVGQQQYRHLAIAAACALAAFGASFAPPIGRRPLFGYLAAALLVLAASLATPAFVHFVTRATRDLLRKLLGVEGLLASQSLDAALRRTAVLIAALITAVAMLVSVGIMVGSFRETVIQWIDSQLRADIFLQPAVPAGGDRFPTLSPDIAGRVAALPMVAMVDQFRAYPIHFRGLPVTLGSGDANVVKRRGAFHLLEGDPDEAYPQMLTSDAAIVSEPFVNKHGVHMGDTIQLPLGDQVRPIRVVGVYTDYSNERGYIIMHRERLLRYLPDPAPSNLAIYLKPGTQVIAAQRAIEAALSDARVLVLPNQTLRREAILIFDRTFAITYALELVAVFVAVTGVAGALLALVIDRRRELSLLRFLGAARTQIRKLILCEAGLIGLLSVAGGMLLGGILSLVLVYVINKQSFGWSIQFHAPIAILLGALTIIFTATLLAGLYPARVALALNPIEVIHEE